MIVLATDYGCCSPYQAQLSAAIARYGAQRQGKIEVLSLYADLVKFRPDLAAYLLPQYFDEFPVNSVFVVVVDPAVGSDKRDPLLIRYKHVWIVCAGDDLIKVLTSRQQDYQAWRIIWQPAYLSKSFHGRDLFAPVAASIDLGEWHNDWYQELALIQNVENAWPEDFAGIVYVDAFGNAMTGIRAKTIPSNQQLQIGDTRLDPAEVFSSVAIGECMYYVNSIGLLEIAANQDSATRMLNIRVGQSVAIISN